MKTFRKLFYFGLGATVYTMEKIEELVDIMIKKGELAKEERSKAIQEMMEEAKSQRKDFEETISENVQKVLSNMGIASKKDLETILNRLDEIEKQIAEHRGETTFG